MRITRPRLVKTAYSAPGLQVRFELIKEDENMKSMKKANIAVIGLICGLICVAA
ncbi:MAG TPA: hypothetical protein V6C97_20800 [Oculatellaceae cyanobacterium]